MTGAMYASIAGLKTHMQKLSVIGNNVANVNTAGYKTKRTVFRDSMYSLYSSGSNGSEVVGGMNPSQIGYGSIIGSIDLDMSSASYNPGNPMDCAIVGDGFFLVGENKEIAASIDPNNPETFKALNLTRVGDFFFGPDGYLVDGNGKVVYGFMNTNQGYKTDPNDSSKTIPDISDQLVPLRKPLMEKAYYEINPTTGERVNPDQPASRADAFDENGNLRSNFEVAYTIRYPVTHSSDTTGNTTTEIPLRDYQASDGGATTDNPNSSTVELSFAQLDSITIDKKTGAITAVTKDGKLPITIGYLAIGNVTNPNGVSHIGSSYYQCDAGAGDLSISMLGGVNKELGIYNVNGSLYRNNTAGGTGGTDNAVELPAKSEITSAGKTELMTGFLEAPNVDLATEISELITTQRGYQANTRIITVTDSMLEELVNMKR